MKSLSLACGLLCAVVSVSKAESIPLVNPEMVSLQVADYAFEVAEPGLYRLYLKGVLPVYIEINLDGSLVYGLEDESGTTRKHETHQAEGQARPERWLYENIWLSKGKHVLRAGISFHGFTVQTQEKGLALRGFEDIGLALEPMPQGIPPRETLAVRELEREDMVLAKNEPLVLDIRQRTDAAEAYTVEIVPQRPKGGYTPWRQAVALAADQPCAHAVVTYPCHEEGVFEYRFLDGNGDTVFGPWAFCVIDATPLALPKMDGAAPTAEWVLVDQVVCADAEDTTHMFRDNGTSVVVQGPEHAYRVVGPTTVHPVNYVRDEKAPETWRLAKPGESAARGMDRFRGFDWFAYSLSVKHAGKPHLLRVTVPADVKRKVVVSVIDPVTRGINSGVFEVAPDAGSASSAPFEMVCWPNTSWMDVMVGNVRSHTDTSDSQGAVISFELLEAPNGLAPLPEAADGWAPGREFGYTIEQRNLGVERFTMAKWWDDDELPDQTLNSGQWGGGGHDLKSMVQSWDRFAAYAAFLGDNFLMYGAHTYFMDMFRTPHFPSGREVYATGWKRRYVDRYPRDIMKMAMMLASKRHARIMVDQHINIQMETLFPEFVMLEDRKHEYSLDEVFLVNDEGSLAPGRYAAVLNPANPLARHYMKMMHGEIAEKYGRYPAFAGVNIRTWLSSSISGYFKNANLGYDALTVRRFCRESEVDMPVIPKSDPDPYRKRREWLKAHCWDAWLDWRIEQVASLRREINAEIRKYAPQARLHSEEAFLSEEKDGGLYRPRFEGQRDLGYVPSVDIGGFGVELNDADPTCFAGLDVRPAVKRITMRNIEPRQISYFTDLVTGGGAAVRNAPNDLRKGIDALAERTVDLFTMGGTWSPPTITPRRRAFVQAFRAIPQVVYRKLSRNSPVTSWYGLHENRLVVYLVNQSFAPQTIRLAFDVPSVTCRDRVTGDKVDAVGKGLVIDGCMIRVLTVDGAAKVESMATRYAPEYLAALEQQVVNVQRIVAAAGEETHRFPGAGGEFIIKTLTDRETSNGDWSRKDLVMTAADCFEPVLDAWSEKDYLATERALETVRENYVWWYEAFGWPEAGYVHTMPRGRLATPHAILAAGVATDARLDTHDGVAGEAVIIPAGEATLACNTTAPYAADLKVYMLSGAGYGPVSVRVDGKSAGTLGVAHGKPAFGRFTLTQSVPVYGGSTVSLSAPPGAPLVLKAVELEEAEPTLMTRWMGVGAFDKENAFRGSGAAVAEGMDKVFPPEKEQDFSADRRYEGLGGKSITWQTIDIGDDKFIQMLEKYFPYDYKGKFNGVAYLTCWVHSPTARAATLYTAADWFYKVWLNGELVISDGSGPWGYFAPHAIGLKQGWNRILVKSACGSASWKQNLALSNPGDLTFSINPPKGPQDKKVDAAHDDPERLYLDGRLSPPSVEVGQVLDGSIVTDGRDDDWGWRGVATIPFVSMRTGSPVVPPEHAKLAWDSECLYMLFHLNQPIRQAPVHVQEGDRGARRAIQEDRLFRSNTVMEVFIELDDDGRDYLEIHISPDGVVADARISCPEPSRERQRAHYGISSEEKTVADWNWDCRGLKAGVMSREDGGWRAELAIPFDALSRLSRSGRRLPFELRELKLNLVCATLGIYEAISGWPFKGINPCHGLDRYATVVLANTAEQAATSPVRDTASTRVWSQEGEVTSADSGWRFTPTENKGKLTFYADEGPYLDRGGKLAGPHVPVPGGEFRFFRYTFESQSAVRCFWAMDFYDGQGERIRGDCYASVHASTGRVANTGVLYGRLGMADLQPYFRSTEPFRIWSPRVEAISASEAARWCDDVYASLPPLTYVPQPGRLAHLSRTIEALRTGMPWRLHILGHSLYNDTYNSNFQALLKRLYPDSQLQVTFKGKGGTGCEHYQHHVKEYVLDYEPDVVIVCGLGHEIREVAAVIRQIKAASPCEVILMSEPFNEDIREHAPDDGTTPLPQQRIDVDRHYAEAEEVQEGRQRPGPMAFVKELERLAYEENIAFLDAKGAWYEYLGQSGAPWEWFHRDRVHANDRGKQVMARILERYFDGRQ